MNFIKHFLFPADLLAILCFAGVAWAQGGNLDRPGQETQFMPPVSTESPYQSSTESPYQSLEASKGSARPKAKETNKQAAKVKNIDKSPMGGRPKTDSRSPSLGQYGASTAQSPSLKIGAMESAPIGRTYNQSGGSASTSFLDGYFLKSLHEERMGRKRSRDDTETKEKFQEKSQKRKVRDNNVVN